jgi:Domain of unknown function (DUF5710)
LASKMLPACYNEFRGNKLYNCIEHWEPQGERVYLSVPFTDKDEVKRLGAKWGRGAPVNEDTMTICDVSYTPAQARALQEWSNRYKSWWYWSGAAVWDSEERMEFVEAVHARSAFAKWEVDTATMRRVWAEAESAETGYANPNPGLLEHKVKTGQAWPGRAPF